MHSHDPARVLNLGLYNILHRWARIYPQGQWTVWITSVVRDARPGARNLSGWTGHGWTGTIVRYHVFACSALAVFVLAFLLQD